LKLSKNGELLLSGVASGGRVGYDFRRCGTYEAARDRRERRRRIEIAAGFEAEVEYAGEHWRGRWSSSRESEERGVVTWCMTPLLVVVLGAVGLTAWLAKADYVLIPALILCLALVAFGLYRRRLHHG
jgi:hypothetical protein